MLQIMIVDLRKSPPKLIRTDLLIIRNVIVKPNTSLHVLACWGLIFDVALDSSEGVIGSHLLNIG